MNGTVKIEIHDAEGRLEYVEEVALRSPLKAFLQILLMRMGAANVAAAIDIGNTSRTLEQADTTTMMAATGAAADDDQGIVVGTNSGGISTIATTVAIDDRALKNQITAGSTTGKFTHDAQSNPDDVTTFSDKAEFQIIRRFANDSGAAISIGEIGIYAEQECTGAVLGVFAIARDIVTTVSVGNGKQATVTYTWRIIE